MYATFSPAIKSSLDYNQKQISRLGVAKDFGNAADIIAGFLSQFVSSRTLLFLGALQFLLGYGFLWLIVMDKIPAPPFWTVLLLIFVGANAQKYLDIAAVVSCLPNFPDSRGSLLGVLKAFKGLSGAIFSLFYSTFFSPLRSAALLIVALGPSVVAFIASFFVRPIRADISKDDKRSEGITYTILYVICTLIAAYMVIVLFFKNDLEAGDYRKILLFSGLILLILMPLIAPVISVSVLNKENSGMGIEAPLVQGLSKIRDTAISDDQNSLLQGLNNSNLQADEQNVAFPITRRSTTGFWRRMGEAFKERPQIGEELTFFQTLLTFEFWLMFMALYCGLGTGSTALDNLAQMAEAQGYENTTTFVSIFSISSYVGHLVGGHMSEVLVSKYTLPRPVSLIVVEGVMLVAQFLFAMAWPGTIYAASGCLGLAYGSFSSINPAISSELFGLKSFGPTFGLLALSAPASSSILAGVIAGALYDKAAEEQGSTDCTGQVCFYVTCWIMVGVCALGMALSAVLSWRTRGVYRHKAALKVVKPA